MTAAYEAVVALPLRGPTGQARDVDAVVDTGFSRFLTLPPAMVSELGLGFRGVNRVILADGSETTLEVYGVTVLWDGRPREVVAYASDTTPLAGMSLLRGHNLSIDVEDGGDVTVRAKE
ncbi:MAG: clan AA aspartic protease [bacterium]|nr:clan AA aspartic protease [bacterium]